MEKRQQTDENTATIADGGTTAGTIETDPVATDLAPPEVDSADEACLARVASEIHFLSEDDGDILQNAGHLLVEAKQRLPQEDQWLAWLEHEFGWTESEASKLIELHETTVDFERLRDLYRNSAAVAAYHDAWLKLRPTEREARDALEYGVGLSLGWRESTGPTFEELRQRYFDSIGGGDREVRDPDEVQRFFEELSSNSDRR